MGREHIEKLPARVLTSMWKILYNCLYLLSKNTTPPPPPPPPLPLRTHEQLYSKFAGIHQCLEHFFLKVKHPNIVRNMKWPDPIVLVRTLP